MTRNNRHIVQKQIFNLTLRKSKDSFAIQQKVSTICKNQLTPLLDKLFSRLVKDDELVRIDKLEIDLGSIAPNDLEKVLSEKIVAALEEKLRDLKTVQSMEIHRSPLNISYFEAWLVFLDKGALPMQMAGIPEREWQQAVLESLASHTSSIQLFRTTILKKPIAFERLVKQSDEDFLHSLLTACFGTKQSPIAWLRKAMLEILQDRSKAEIRLLFARDKITKRAFFVHFWKSAIQLSLQQNQPVSNSLLITHVLQSLSSPKQATLEVLTICKALEGQEMPLEVLKLVFIKIEKEEFFPTNTKKTILPTAEEEALPLSKNEEQINETDKVAPASEEETDTKVPAQKIESQDDLEFPSEKLEEGKLEIEKKRKEDNLEDEDLITKGIDNPASAEEQNKALKKEQSDHSEPIPNSEKDSKSSIADLIKLENQLLEEELSLSSKKENIPETETKESKVQKGFEDLEPSQDIPKTTTEISALETTLPEGTYFYIQHAGMVLIHPFIKTYFDKIGLLKNNQFKDKTAQEKAVHLLNFLAGGPDGPPEYELILPKLLCNLALNFPVDRMVELTKAEKKEGNQMLQAVINHWGVLGNVGPDSLRQGFLQREGKLEKRAGGWHLIIERNTIDILMDKLPWGISLVKLPWMPEMLNVEWIS